MRTIDFQDDTVQLIDRTRLPHELELVECRTSSDLGQAIRWMPVRGAIAIGVAAAFGMVRSAQHDTVDGDTVGRASSPALRAHR